MGLVAVAAVAMAISSFSQMPAVAAALPSVHHIGRAPASPLAPRADVAVPGLKPADSCTLPSAVTGVTATAGVHKATVSWTPGSSGSAPLAAYIVREVSGPNSGQSVANDGTTDSLTMTGLAGGAAARFSVVAETSCGKGPVTDSASVTPSGNGTTYQSTVIADKPSVFYQLAETSGTVMADSSGAQEDGTYSSQVELGQPGALLTDQAAPSAAPVPGYNSGVGTSPAALPQFNDPRSVSAWVNTTAAVSYNPLIVGWGTGGVDGGFVVGIGQSEITVDGFFDKQVIPTDHPVEDGNWHFVVVTYNGSVISAYLDGRLQGTATFGSLLSTIGSSLSIGGEGDAYQGFGGDMQDVAIYPDALTAAQVAAQYAVSGYAAPAPPPAVHAVPAGANAAQVTWGQRVNAAEPTLGYLITVASGPSAGMSLSEPADATAAQLGGLLPGAATFTVTAVNASGPGAPATTNSLVVAGRGITYASLVRADGADLFCRLGDESALWLTDSSGQGSAGTYDSDVTFGAPGPILGDVSTATTVGQDGIIGSSGGSPPAYNEARTAEVWFTTTDTTEIEQYQGLLSWGGSGTDQGFIVAETPHNVWVDGSNDAHAFATPYLLNDGHWHFVAVTYDGTTMTVYLDGVSIGTGYFDQPLDTSPPASAGGAPAVGLYLGQAIPFDQGGLSDPLFQGSLADAAVFGSALTGKQIAAQFAASGRARPAVPGSVTATAGTNRATIHWRPATAPGSSVTGYLVTALEGGTVAANAVAVSGSATSATVTGLAGGESYQFQVQAEDYYGAGGAGTTSAAVKPAGTASTYTSTVLANDPVAYYRLGDSTDAIMADSSGHRYQGTYNAQGATLGLPGAISGDQNRAAGIANGGIGIGQANVTSLPLDNDQRSVVAWVKESTTPAPDPQSLVSWGQPQTDQAFQVMVQGNWQVGVDAWNDPHWFLTPYPLDDGSWHQVAVTYGSLGYDVYVDGKLIGSGQFGNRLETQPSPLYLGGSGILSTGPPGSVLGDVSVYSTVLTAAQVAAQFTAAGYAVPAKSADVSAKAGANQATVTWTASSSARSYLVTAVAGSQAQDSVSVAGSAGSAVVGGLSGGTSYTFKVAAVNAYGAGPTAVTSAVTPTGTSGTYSSVVFADQPSAYLRLGDSATSLLTNSTGNHANGSYDSGDVTLGTGGAIVGDPTTSVAVSFGTGAGAVPAQVPLDNSPRTVEAWFESADSNDDGSLIGWGQYDQGASFDCGLSTAGIVVDDGSQTLTFPWPYQPAQGHWYQLDVTYNGSVVTAYLDGKALGTRHFSGALNTLPSLLYLGSAAQGNNAWGEGSLAQVSVYPTALSATRIASHFAASGYGPPSAPGGVTAVAGANEATVRWTKAASPGSAVTAYVVTAYLGGKARNARAVPATSTSAVISGLAGGASYTFKVQALNPYGIGLAGASAAVAPAGSADTYATAVLADGPDAYYRLDDSTTSAMADSSGNGGLGSYHEFAVTLGVPGAISGDPDTAVSTDGLIGTADPSLPDEQQNRTVVGWVQSTDSGQQYFAGWGTSNISEGFSVGFDQNDVYVDEYGNTLAFSTATTISDGNWHQIAVSATGTSATAYLDGVSLGTQSFPAPLDTAPGQRLQIGAAVWGYTGLLGDLDDLAIFPSALSAAQISSLFAAVPAAFRRPPGTRAAPPHAHARPGGRGKK